MSHESIGACTCVSHPQRSKAIQTYTLLHFPKESFLYEVAEMMIKATNEERGTMASLAALSQDLDNEHADGMC